jgi:ABC-type sugar transport system substrate-binding protein
LVDIRLRHAILRHAGKLSVLEASGLPKIQGRNEISRILPRRVCAQLTTAVLAATALATMASQSRAADQKTIAVIVPTLKIAVLQIESKAAVDRAEKLGYKAIVLTHDFNTANELKDADQIITEKVAGAVWNVADPDASAVSVKKVRDAGIPVVNIDRVLTKPNIANASIQSDNF